MESKKIYLYLLEGEYNLYDNLLYVNNNYDIVFINEFNYNDIYKVINKYNIVSDNIHFTIINEAEGLKKDALIRDFKEYVKKFDDWEDIDDIINEYFTGVFYDIEDDDDLEEVNEAEEYIRSEYLNN